MLTLTSFEDSDIKELLNGFSTSFMQAPMAKPVKSLIKHIPNGFRVNKLQRYQLIRVFCDAITSGEPSITNYVLREISHRFEESEITSIVEEIVLDTPEDHYKAVCRLEIALRKANLEILPDLVLLLVGTRCSDEIKEISRTLHSTYFNAIKAAYENGIKQGGKIAETTVAASITAEQKRYDKAMKALNEEKRAHEQTIHKLSEASERIAELSDEIQSLHSDLMRECSKNDTITKQLCRTKNEKEQKEAIIKSLHIQLEQLSASITELEMKCDIIPILEEKLSEAESFTFSAGLIKGLCSEVIEDLRADSLGSEQVYQLACRRYDENISIEDAWRDMSENSVMRIRKLFEEFTAKRFNNQQIDELDEIENDVLIKYLTIKSLRSLLYQALENQNVSRAINEKFL